MGYRSRTVIGREREIALMAQAAAEARAGRGQVLLLTGETGIGKSRLAEVVAERAETAGMDVLRGRGSALGRTIPYRCLSEAMLSLQRRGSRVDAHALGAYRPALARLNPDWRQDTEAAVTDSGVAGTADSSPIVLAEGLLRLTELIGRTAGCVVVLDDLHYADPDTLVVLEYIGDNLAQQRTLLVGTMRDESSAMTDLAVAMRRRGTATILPLVRMDRSGVSRLVLACRTAAGEAGEVPDSVVDLLWAGSGGLPLLVEELLPEVLEQPADVEVGNGPPRPGPTAPVVLMRSVAERLSRLDALSSRVVSAAAVLGLRFALPVLRVVVALDEQALLRCLRSAALAHLVEPDEAPDRYSFTHALVSDAVLALLPESTRRELAAVAADAVEALYPGLSGDWCHLAAGLREAAGQDVAAGELHAMAGRRALARGAAQTAVTLLDRALALLVADPRRRFTALETQLLALTEAGQTDRALALVDDPVFDEVTFSVDPVQLGRLHTRLAWAANQAGRTDDGLMHVRIGRAFLEGTCATEYRASLDVVAAHLEVDRPTPEGLELAELMALRGAQVAEQVPAPEVACRAWQLLGALVRRRDPDLATAHLERSLALATRHGNPLWEIHALVRLGLDDALRHGVDHRLLQARAMATRLGAVTARFQAEVNLTLHSILTGDTAGAQRLIDEVCTAATRLDLRETHQFMVVLSMVLAGHRGDRAAMDVAERSLGAISDRPGVHTVRSRGLAGVYCALLEENRDRARLELRATLDADREQPSTSPVIGLSGLEHLLTALEDDPLRPGRRAEPTAPLHARWDRHFHLLGDAVLLGRRGDGAAATRSAARAWEAAAVYPMAHHLGLRLLAEPAAADGWGEPADWLRRAEEHFHSTAVPAVARACRARLRGLGVRVGQRRTGTEQIPEPLRRLGVTGREFEVLQLIADRRDNNEIAVRLQLSRRTVEKHIANLRSKTGRESRQGLRALLEFSQREDDS